MSKERSQRALEIFREILEVEGPRRADLLDAACRSDPTLRSRVEAMLAADTEEGEFLEQPACLVSAPDGGAESLVGTRIGNYRIERILSSGGMGTVFEATQENPRRKVAIKVMREGIASPTALRRFEYESQILGRLRHPGIAQVFEAGTHGGDGESGGVPYFVMEFIPDARTITDYARDRNLDVPARLRLFTQVCEAVHHGHQKGVIHRDLKPGNVLVDAGGRPKIIDFGVARATDSDLALTTLQTEVGQILGTVQYMSPEQCEGGHADLDIRSDVYALGVVLYELLCMSLPYEVRDLSIFEAVRRIREDPPARPSTRLRTLRGDVETIVLKTLEKDRSRRYQSADELCRDIDRYLSGQPISARPPSFAYQLRTFARRNKALVVGVATVFLVLLAGVITSSTLYVRARHEAETARTINAFFNKMLASVDPAQLNIATGFREYEELTPVTTKGVARDVSVAEMMRWATERIETAFAGKPELEALVRETIGTTFFNLGLFEDARSQLEISLAIRTDRLGRDHPATLRSLVQLGNLLRMADEPARAEQVLRPALEGLRRTVGAEHRDTLCCASVLAASLCLQGKPGEGDRLFEETLATQRRVLGPEDRLTLWTLCDWSFDLARRSATRRGEELASEAYETACRVLDPEDYITAYAESCLGFFLGWRGEHAKALQLLRSAYESRRRFLGEGHPRTCGLKHFIADNLRGEATVEERIRLWNEAASCLRGNLGEQHYWTVVVLRFYSSFLADSRRYEELESLLRDTLERRRSALGDAHPTTLEATRSMAFYLIVRGRRDEGMRCLGEHLDRVRAESGDTDLSTLAALADASGMLFDLDEHEASRQYLEAAIEGWQRRLASPDATAPEFDACARLLVECEPEDLRDPTTALSLAREAVERSRGEEPEFLETLALAEVRGGGAPQALRTLERAASMPPSRGRGAPRHRLRHIRMQALAAVRDREGVERLLSEGRDRLHERAGDDLLPARDLLMEDLEMLVLLGQYELAEPRARECLDLLARWAAGEPRWRPSWAEALLGRCLAGLGRHDEAEPLLREGYAGVRDCPLPIAGPARRLARRWIVELYEETGRPDEAEEYRRGN
jgi:non-specific serine/threonine protein kinase/serine/threonine-protein kinase